MGKKNVLHNAAGKKILHPADAVRKQAKKRKLEKWKKQRMEHFEGKLLTQSPADIEQEIHAIKADHARKRAAKQPVSKTQQDYLTRLEVGYKRLKEKVDEKHNERLKTPKSNLHVDFEELKVHRKASVFYHPVMNPYGAPPAGQSLMYRHPDGSEKPEPPPLPAGGQDASGEEGKAGEGAGSSDDDSDCDSVSEDDGAEPLLPDSLPGMPPLPPEGPQAPCGGPPLRPSIPNGSVPPPLPPGAPPGPGLPPLPPGAPPGPGLPPLPPGPPPGTGLPPLPTGAPPGPGLPPVPAGLPQGFPPGFGMLPFPPGSAPGPGLPPLPLGLPPCSGLPPLPPGAPPGPGLPPLPPGLPPNCPLGSGLPLLPLGAPPAPGLMPMPASDLPGMFGQPPSGQLSGMIGPSGYPVMSAPTPSQLPSPLATLPSPSVSSTSLPQDAPVMMPPPGPPPPRLPVQTVPALTPKTGPPPRSAASDPREGTASSQIVNDLPSGAKAPPPPPKRPASSAAGGSNKQALRAATMFTPTALRTKKPSQVAGGVLQASNASLPVGGRRATVAREVPRVAEPMSVDAAFDVFMSEVGG